MKDGMKQMTDFKETAVGYLNVDSYAIFNSSEQKWINKILKLQESHPNDVQIEHWPENNNGMIQARIPKSWLKVSPPRQREMTDEQREAATIRLAEARAKRNG
jgi:hypothetical protein